MNLPTAHHGIGQLLFENSSGLEIKHYLIAQHLVQLILEKIVLQGKLYV
jgi:hypothetical protein